VVIATVFLTIIGMTAGFVLGERDRRDADAPGAAGETPTTTQTQQTTTPVSGPLCPSETQQTAARLGLPGELRQVLRIVTDNGTTVWICEDPVGHLYYQGKTGGTKSRLVEGKNGLFLVDVTRQGPDEYQAIADDGNRILVSRVQLRVLLARGGEQVHEVVSD
jgi:hypothetical protein